MVTYKYMTAALLQGVRFKETLQNAAVSYPGDCLI
jgi:hypothetical protein